MRANWGAGSDPRSVVATVNSESKLDDTLRGNRRTHEDSCLLGCYAM